MKAADYTVGWICAVQTEYVVAQEMLDEEHPRITTPLQDENIYMLGRMVITTWLWRAFRKDNMD
jgi:hypothetical protein